MRAVEKKIDNTFYTMCEKITTLRKFAHIIRDKEVCPAIPTIAVVYNEDKTIKLIYNPTFIKNSSTDELRFLISHELTHILLQHLQRYNEHVKHQTYRTCSLWNIVADAYVNEFLLTKHFVPDSLIESGVFFRDLGKMGITREEFDNGTCESTYDKLEELNEDEEEQQDSQSQSSNENDNSNDENNADNSGGDNGNNGNSGESQNSNENGSNSGENNTGNNNGDNNNDSNSDEENSSAEETDNSKSDGEAKPKPIDPRKNALSKQIAKAIETDRYFREMENAQYAEICEEVYADELPSGKRELDLIEGVTVDWNDKLRNFIDGVGTMSTRVRSSKRVNKRYHESRPHSKGMYKSSVNNIITSIDVSGSMDAKRINIAVSAIDSLSKLNSVEFEYCFFADNSTEPKTFTDMQTFMEDLKNAGSGGTVWEAATKYFTDDYNGAVLISDMCFFGIGDINEQVEELPIEVQLVNVEEIELPA